jgi:hypothetical protein
LFSGLRIARELFEECSKVCLLTEQVAIFIQKQLKYSYPSIDVKERSIAQFAVWLEVKQMSVRTPYSVIVVNRLTRATDVQSWQVMCNIEGFPHN